MADDSYLDDLYFIDDKIYNCPFCNRKHVSYSIVDFFQFDWTNDKKCYGYIVQCHSCKNKSMHLTYKYIDIRQINLNDFGNHRRFVIKEDMMVGEILNKIFFYSIPTSFYVLDRRVPRLLRELLTEAEGSLKNNFLTGASACVRKIIYELALMQEAAGDNYETRIKSLRNKLPEVDSNYFDTLLAIQDVIGMSVQEKCYDGWEAKHLRLILATIKEVLHEIFVLPALKKDRWESIRRKTNELIPPNNVSRLASIINED